MPSAISTASAGAHKGRPYTDFPGAHKGRPYTDFPGDHKGRPYTECAARDARLAYDP